MMAPDTDDSYKELLQKYQKQSENFTELLNTISSKLDKKKMLWKQIYENALEDRRNAFIAFTDLYLQVHGKPEQHTLNGLILTKYMERMSKANEQIIKLAELVAGAEEKIEEEQSLSSDDIYDQINKKN